jgi:tetratricopeptide (TPR) repeat protein
MSLDQYSLCPCGNGKKIKFCKCHEHYVEIEKLDRMIQGEQMVAALDYANQLLKSLPSEPWLLAMKCEVLLKLQEIENLEETSAKFIRLQPDNPLAKLYRSLVAVIRGNAEEGCNLLLQSLAATNGPLHPFFLTASVNLIELLINSRRHLTALMHTEILLTIADGMEQAEQLAGEMLSSISTDDRTSILQRESLPSPPDADDQPYAERYREALALLSKTNIAQCKTKLDGIVREFGPQAPLLITRLHCQVLLADTDGAAETALRLAKTESLPFAQRVYFQALAFEFSPRKSGTSVDMEVAVYEIADQAEIETKLIACSKLTAVNSEMMRDTFQAISDEEVPPKAMYVVTIPIFGDRFGASRPKASGQWIALLGKQTDKPARLFAFEPRCGYQADWMKEVSNELGLADLKREVKTVLPSTAVSFFDCIIQVEKRPENHQSDEFGVAARDIDREHFLKFPVPIFNGGTPMSVAGEAQYQTELAALILQWEAGGKTKLSYDDFEALYRELKIDFPKLDSTEDVFDLVGGASYFMVDLEKIDPQTLLQLAQSALQRGVRVAMSKLADRIAATQWPDEMFISADYTRLSLLARIERDPEKADVILMQLIEKGKAMKFSIGSAVLERCRVLNMLGRSQEAGEFFLKTYRENPNDPVLTEYFQMMVMRQAQSDPKYRDELSQALSDRSAAPSKAATPASGSKLWTPDQGSASESAPQGSGSGLWIPGQ